MDEPFVGLDPKASHLLKEMMREVCDKGGAIFFSKKERCGMFMNDYSRSLINGIIWLIVSVIFIVMSSYYIAAIYGIVSVVLLGKAFVEWRKNEE